jgi:multiple sugar transport system permease protein
MVTELATLIKRRFSLSWDSNNDTKTAYMYLIPSIFIMLLTFAYPMIEAIVQSFYRWNPLRYGLSKKFIFLENYEQILKDPLFYKTLWNSLCLTVGGVGIEFVLGLAVALFLYEDIKMKRFVKTAVIIPMMMAPILAGLIWKMLTDNEFGLFNHTLRLLHLPTINWIGEERWVLPTIILADVWQNTSFVILVLLAGLQAIPVEQFEAADVDGANKWQMLTHVVLPWLKPLILIVLLFRVLFIFRTFDMIYMLVGSAGGIANTAMVFGIYLYHSAFQLFNFGVASSLSIIMLIITAMLSITFTVMLYRTLKV